MRPVPQKPVITITGNEGQWIRSGLYRYAAFHCPAYWADSVGGPFGASCDVSYAFHARPKWHIDIHSNRQTLIGLRTEIFGVIVERLELWKDSGDECRLDRFDIERITSGITNWFCHYSIEHARSCEIKNSKLCQEILKVI